MTAPRSRAAAHPRPARSRLRGADRGLEVAAVPQGLALVAHALLGLLPSGLQAGARRNAWAGTAEARARTRAWRETDAALDALAGAAADARPDGLRDRAAR